MKTNGTVLIDGVDLTRYMKDLKTEAITFETPRVSTVMDTLYPIPDPTLVEVVWSDWVNDFGVCRRMRVQGPRLEEGELAYDFWAED